MGDGLFEQKCCGHLFIFFIPSQIFFVRLPFFLRASDKTEGMHFESKCCFCKNACLAEVSLACFNISLCQKGIGYTTLPSLTFSPLSVFLYPRFASYCEYRISSQNVVFAKIPNASDPLINQLCRRV